jgi:hypothetical protein
MMKLMLYLLFGFIVVQSHAQTVTHYTKTGVLIGTHTTIASALSAVGETDSLVLSAHKFNERNLITYKQIVLQGTISGGDTTTIDASGSPGACIIHLKGTIRDIVLTGASNGAIKSFIGTLGGNTTIRDNTTSDNIVWFRGGVIQDNVKIINNTLLSIDNVPIVITEDALSVVIKDNVLISGNRGGVTGALRLDGTQRGDSTVLKNTSSLTIEGNVKFENNEGEKAGAILVYKFGARYLNISGATFVNNRCLNPKFGAAITVDTGGAVDGSVPADSVAVSYVRLNKVRMYNPLPDGSRQAEIRLCNRRGLISTTFKPSTLYSEGTWFGDSDTTGLINRDANTIFSMPNWSVAHWFCIPTGAGKSDVVAQMRLNTGATLPTSSLKTLEGKFSATAGSFSAATVPISSSNEMISNYTIPSSPFIVTASVDADTFHPNLKELSIKTPGFEQVKIYPNPATDVIQVSGAEEGSTLTLTDITGRVVVQQTVTSNNGSISVGHLVKGTYLLHIMTQDGHNGSTKVLKE